MQAEDNTARWVPIVQQLFSAHDLETIMNVVKVAAKELTGADGVTFSLKENDECFFAEEEAINPLWRGKRIPMEKCIDGWSIRNHEQVFIEDITRDNRVSQDVYSALPIKSLIVVPIHRLDPIGALGSYWTNVHVISSEGVLQLQTLADVTAVAVENVKRYATLEQRLDDRTRQLEEANKEMDAFSYSISHDLRAPLRSIQLYTDMLETDHTNQLDESGKKILNKLLSKTQNMEKLIKDLLEFFRMGKKELIYQQVSMSKMVEDIVHSWKKEETIRDIEFIVHPLPLAIADSVLIKQVWTNLISNAVKYTGYKEKAVIEIGAEEKTNTIVYFIKDNGAGFDMRYADKLFKIFQRLHSQEKFEGVGIGLSFVQRIIKKHRGKVWAEAKEDQGATFFFELNKTQSEDSLI
jgi:signal transduction histidine kinase